MTKTFISLTAAATMVVTSLGVAAPAAARDHYRNYRGDYSRDYRYNDRDYRDYRDSRYARDARYRDSRYASNRYRCSNDGTTGTIVGAIAGGLLGHEVAGRRGDKTAGVIIGGAVGAIAGRAIDKGNGRC
jgi:uncharacterized protein YcfJ